MTDQKFSHIANVTFISACDNLAREFCDTDFYLETNDNNQLVID